MGEETKKDSTGLGLTLAHGGWARLAGDSIPPEGTENPSQTILQGLIY